MTVESLAAQEVTVLITDHGIGSTNPFTGLLAANESDERSLELIYDALADVVLWRENATTKLAFSARRG